MQGLLEVPESLVENWLSSERAVLASIWVRGPSGVKSLRCEI